MARDALHDKEIYQVVGGFMSPVSDEYQKVGLEPSRHRLEMCRLAVAGSDWIDVDEWESCQSSYQRTVQVLGSLQERLDEYGGGARVMLLAGADLIKSFETPGLWAPEDVTAPFC
ncbi:Nucleotidylyl transferase [Paramicrosporidium saccamoebae]|uniref:Nucleotidylyl transferase n=1 Tax=Paramicrosporidium saccamoebae TaxID=1246581 RepID=A0A2H9TJR1_9FUNG|nr:Nucleotidylyl transferase [Paramicrosporidium saccamoebae]